MWVWPQPCPRASRPRTHCSPTPTPARGRTAGQQQRDVSASLLAPRCLQDGVQTLRRSQEARDALLWFSPSPLQPLLSAYPANGSLTSSLGKYFLEDLLCARRCPGHSHGPNRQTLAFVERTLGGRGCLQAWNTPPCLQLLLPPLQALLLLANHSYASEAGPKCPSGLKNSVRRAWDTSTSPPRTPQPQSQTETSGSERHSGQGAESHRRGFPLYLQL